LEISPALIETLITLAIGAVLGAFIGFIASIGLETWKENNDKKELKKRMRENFQMIKPEIEAYIRSNDSLAHAFFIDVYLALKPDLIRKLDVKTSQSIMETWIKIESLKFPINVPEMRIKKYREVLDSINETLRLLD
jgi:type II secretory pathway pseudopilin PulG